MSRDALLPIPADAIQDPGGLLPVQVGSRSAAARARTPQIRLMRAVLASAVSDYLGFIAHPSARSRAAHVAASRWMSPHRRDEWPFSFERICATLDLDPDAVRDALERRAARRRRRIAPVVPQRVAAALHRATPKAA